MPMSKAHGFQDSFSSRQSLGSQQFFYPTAPLLEGVSKSKTASDVDLFSYGGNHVQEPQLAPAWVDTNYSFSSR
jgi:hypothetical protein